MSTDAIKKLLKKKEEVRKIINQFHSDQVEVNRIKEFNSLVNLIVYGLNYKLELNWRKRISGMFHTCFEREEEVFLSNM